jgi:hypothetical protein
LQRLPVGSTIATTSVTTAATTIRLSTIATMSSMSVKPTLARAGQLHFAIPEMIGLAAGVHACAWPSALTRTLRSYFPLGDVSVTLRVPSEPSFSTIAPSVLSNMNAFGNAPTDDTLVFRRLHDAPAPGHQALRGLRAIAIRRGARGIAALGAAAALRPMHHVEPEPSARY